MRRIVRSAIRHQAIKMGNIIRCRRRVPTNQFFNNNFPHVDNNIVNDGWELIPPNENPANVDAPLRQHRFRRAVRKILRLLILRKIWSRLGNYLNAIGNNHASRVPNNPLYFRRNTLRSVWGPMGNYLFRYAALFKHLKRRSGRLEYRYLQLVSDF